MPEPSLPCCELDLVPFAPLCCALPDDAVEVVLLPLPPLWLALLLPLPRLALFWLLLALLVSVVLFELWLFAGAGAGVLADDDGVGEGAGAGVGVGAGALCATLLVFCASMLCCKVCENGWLLTMSTGEFVCELPDEPNSELIYESGDMADLSLRESRSSSARAGHAVTRSNSSLHAFREVPGLRTLGAHPENPGCMFVGVALFAPRQLLGFRAIAARLQDLV